MAASVDLAGTCNFLRSGSAIASPLLKGLVSKPEEYLEPRGLDFVENNVNRRRWGRTAERDKYVSKEEFVGVFASEQQGLQRLAFLLTANAEAVAQCLSLALQECLATNLVFKGRAPTWARRMVIRNAISLVMSPGDHSFVNTNRDADDGPAPFSLAAPRNGLAASKSIVDLPDLERFVFVICIREQYSIHDCALLLRKSPRDINETRRRLDGQVGNLDELINI